MDNKPVIVNTWTLIITHTNFLISSTFNSTKPKTTRVNSNNGRSVPPIIIKKILNNGDLHLHSTLNSDDEFRSPRRTSKIYSIINSSTKNIFITPNRYSILDKTNTKDQEMFTFNDDTLSIT